MFDLGFQFLNDLLELRHFALGAQGLLRLDENGPELVRRERLLQIVESTELGRLHRGGNGCVCGENNHQLLGLHGDHLLEDLQSVLVAKAQVQKYEVEVFLLDALHGEASVLRRFHIMPLAF